MTELGAYRHTLMGGHNQSCKGEIERTKEFTKRTRQVRSICHHNKNCGVYRIEEDRWETLRSISLRGLTGSQSKLRRPGKTEAKQ